MIFVKIAKRQFCQRFGKETSIAGISNAANSKSWVRAFIWSAIFIGLAVLTVQGIVEVRFCLCSKILEIHHIAADNDNTNSVVQILVEFWEWPIVTSTDVSYKAKVDFPAVTICNLNRMNCHNAFQVFTENPTFCDHKFF